MKDEFCETKKELARNTREMARLRKAIDIGTVADALRSVRLQRRGAAAGRTQYIQEKEQPPGSKAEDAPTTRIIRPGLLSGGTYAFP